MTDPEHERRLRGIMDRHADGSPISDKEHQDARLSIIALLLMNVEATERNGKKIESATIDPEMMEELRAFLRGRRAWIFVGQTLKAALTWIAIVIASIIAIRTAAEDWIAGVLRK